MKIAVFVCMILTVGMIFSFSLKDAEESSEQSDWVAEKLSEIVEVVESTVNTEVNIRKVAHFCEYALLGAETAFLCILIKEYKKKKWIVAVIFGILTASIDESIQYFVPGRGPGIKDVCIDMGGYIAGTLFTLCICFIVFTIKAKKQKRHVKTRA